MRENQEKIIMLPQWREQLEQRATQAMQDNHFREAYDYFHQLTENGVHSHEVMTGKLICMMELNMQMEAEELCEQLIAKKDHYYPSYIHIYATLLFQLSKYEEVMFLIDDALKEEIPDHIRSQLQHVYQLSEELQHQEDEKSFTEVTAQLEQAIDSNNSRQQWYMIKRLIGMGIYKRISIYQELLTRSDIHPVVKTALLEYFQKAEIKTPIHIEKFNLTADLMLKLEEPIIPASFFSGVTYYLDDVLQEDPTKYQMIQFILERFAYVYTPFLPQKEDYQLLAEALLHYVSKSFQLPDEASQSHEAVMKQHYLDMITLSDKLYTSILDI
ncbi:hypothetical protein [Gracilibacillus alcaliphilus]|uniref:hypothetical protein n=1 Tax=Gracilibacillus alcaliphilus TaxID=1401441 RepID=UPI001959C09A|nr:hypothetical protein [Gracilibacillus alcaliphilus]MBM7678533.1 tetratricopeptide (TPR) repeat protein [Gracilibacillus alcaliphilus]